MNGADELAGRCVTVAFVLVLALVSYGLGLDVRGCAAQTAVALFALLCALVCYYVR